MKKREGFSGQRSAILPDAVLKQIADHPLCEGLYISDIGYYPKAAFHSRERRRGSPQHILIYCVRGEGWYQLRGQTYRVGPNQFFLLPAGELHRYGADGQNPWSIYWVHFTGLRSNHYLTYLQPEDQLSPVIVPAHDERFRLFDDIIAHVEMSFNPDNLIYANNSFAHFLATFRHSVFNPKPDQHAAHDPIQQSILYMKANLTQHLTLDELARQAGMSVSHYSAIFRQKVQRAPVTFFTFLKIQLACHLLLYTTNRIKEIGYEIGFNDPFHFSRVFTTVMGMSPRKFRETGKG